MALAALGYGGYQYLLSRRPELPQVKAEEVSFFYLTALQGRDYATAYNFASTTAQGKTSPQQMANACAEVYSQIDAFQVGEPSYSPTHTSASVPVILQYRPSWATDEPRTLHGQLNYRLENGQWRLIVALPFVTAIMKQRDEQHMGGG